jgi:hypothetical protein
MSTFIPTGLVTTITATTAGVAGTVIDLGSNTVMIDNIAAGNVTLVQIASPTTVGLGDQFILLPGQTKIITCSEISKRPGVLTITATALTGTSTIYVAPGQVN